MKTLKPLLIVVGILFYTLIKAQTMYPTNNPNINSPLGYLGWNDTQNTLLDIQQNRTIRMRFNSTNWTGYNISGGTNNASRVFMGINGNTMATPFSMLHLGYNIGTTLRRDWMNVGTTYGASADFMHVGLMVSPNGAANNSIVDAIIGWGDNDDIFFPNNGPDNLRFLFIAPTTSTSPANVAEGIETMRITPRGNVGIGDFSQMPNGIGATYGQPRARLDVQFRNDIPLNTDNVAINGFNWANDPISPPSLEKIAVRGWARATSYVGQVIGGRFIAERGDKTVGVYAEARGGGNGASFGVLAFTNMLDQDDQHFGVYGQASGAIFDNVGVYGEGFSSDGSFAAGIEGRCQQNSPNNWGGYFSGRTFCTLGVWSASDENIKTDITNIENATEMLMALQPKHYTYNQNITQLDLDNEYHFGFLAQEMQEIVPELVRDMITPIRTDSSGNVIEESAQFKAVQYEGIIPILVAGFKEQSTVVTDQEAQIAIQNETIANLEAQLEAQASEMEQQASEMEQQATKLEQIQNEMQSVLAAVQTMQQKIKDADQRVSTCCTLKTETGETEAIINESQKELELEQNVPNPFDDQTRIAFYLPQTADVILEITDAAGRPLERLIDGKMSNGEHTTLWDGSKVASGIYFYTLYADGHLITKKMIKH